jgi:hypothetical protein
MLVPRRVLWRSSIGDVHANPCEACVRACDDGTSLRGDSKSRLPVDHVARSALPVPCLTFMASGDPERPLVRRSDQCDQTFWKKVSSFAQKFYQKYFFVRRNFFEIRRRVFGIIATALQCVLKINPPPHRRQKKIFWTCCDYIDNFAKI